MNNVEINAVGKPCPQPVVMTKKELSEAGKAGVIEYVKECISDAGPNPCPPLTVGIGIGGTFEKAVISSKHALFRNIGSVNEDPEMAEMEESIPLLLTGEVTGVL